MRELDFVQAFGFELRFVAEERHIPTGLRVGAFFLEVRRDDRHIDHIAEVRVNRNGVRDAFEFRGEALRVGFRGGVAAAFVRAAFAVRVDQFVFADEVDAVADELHRGSVFGHNDAIVIRLEVPTNEGVASATARVRAFGVGRQFDRRFFEADPDQLHAVVGGDEGRGEVRFRRNAPNLDVLKAERVRHSERVIDDLSVVREVRMRRVFQVRLHVAETFGGRVDRATDEFVPFAFGRERAESDDEVFEFQRRATAAGADGRAFGSDGPTFGRAGDDDFARFRINVNVFNAGQTGEVRHIRGNDAVVFLNRFFEAGQRNFAFFADGFHFARNAVKRGLTHRGERSVVENNAFENAVRANDDAGTVGASAAVVVVVVIVVVIVIVVIVVIVVVGERDRSVDEVRSRRGNGDENRQRQKGAPSKEGTDPTHKNLLKIRLGWTVKIRTATGGPLARCKESRTSRRRGGASLSSASRAKRLLATQTSPLFSK